MWLATGAHGHFWPGWVMLAVAIGLAREGIRAFGPGAGFSDEELGLQRERRGRRRLG